MKFVVVQFAPLPIVTGAPTGASAGSTRLGNETLGARSKLTLELEIKGHGVGVFFALLARASARKEIPKSHERLREILERDNRRDAA